MKKKHIDTIKEIFLGIFFVILISFQLISLLHRFIEHRFERILPALSNYVNYLVKINFYVDLLHLFLYLIISFFPVILCWIIFFTPQKTAVYGFLNFYSLTGQYLMMFATTILVCTHIAEIEILIEGFIIIFSAGLFLTAFSEITYILKLKEKTDFKMIYMLIFLLIFGIVFFQANSSMKNPVRKNAVENNDILFGALYNETLINNAILRYREFTGDYPSTLYDLVDNKDNSLYLDTIPINTFSGKKDWIHIIDLNTDRITAVTIKYDSRYPEKKIYSRMRLINDHFRIIEYQIIFTVILFSLIIIMRYKNFNESAYENYISIFTMVNSLIFFTNLLLILYISRPFWVIILDVKWIP